MSSSTSNDQFPTPNFVKRLSSLLLLLRRSATRASAFSSLAFQLSLEFFGVSYVVGIPTSLRSLLGQVVASPGSKFLRLFVPPFLPISAGSISFLLAIPSTQYMHSRCALEINS